MSDSALVAGAIYSPRDSSAGSPSSANNTQEIVIEPASLSKAIMLASEKSLTSAWMTTDEEVAWKDL